MKTVKRAALPSEAGSTESEYGMAAKTKLVKTATCGRCKRQLRISETRREDSKPFRRSLTDKGLCPECVVTEFLYNSYPLNMQIDEAGPELLLKPGLVQAFATFLENRCEMAVDEIDWQRLVDQWGLPVAVIKKNPLNPYKMGDSPRAKARLAGGSPASYWPMPNQNRESIPSVFKDLGKEQYCPKCGKRAGSTQTPLGGYMTDCSHCGFKSARGIWIRAINEQVQ